VGEWTTSNASIGTPESASRAMPETLVAVGSWRVPGTAGGIGTLSRVGVSASFSGESRSCLGSEASDADDGSAARASLGVALPCRK